MPKFQITSPDGKSFEITAPDGATQEQVLAFAQSQFGGGKVAPAPQPQIDPTEGMSGLDKFRAGVGKELYNLGRGVGTLVTDAIPSAEKLGFATRKDVDEAKKRDAPLMNTGAGMAGSIFGNVAAMLPTAMIPGANTITGGAVLGAAASALQPVGTDESRLGNMKLGAVTGAAIPAVARGWNVVKGLSDPLTEAGRQKIVGGAINRAAADPLKAAEALRANAGSTPGFMPTAGQAANDAGIASLERTARGIDPGGFDTVDKSQMSALVDALRSVAKTPEARATAVKQVEEQSRKLYGEAFKESVPVTPELSKLATRPSMRRAESRAVGLADELSIPFQARLSDMVPKHIPIERPVAPSVIDTMETIPGKSIPIEQPRPTPSMVPEPYNAYRSVDPGSVVIPGEAKPHGFFEVPETQVPKTLQIKPDPKPQGYFEVPPVESVPVRDMHTLKMGMDALMADPTLGIAGREASAINRTRNQLLDMLPESYQVARKGHIEMNRPVNQMDIGKELYNRFVPALADGSGVPFKSRAQAFADALRNGDELAQNVTGLKNAKLDTIMAPEQMQLLNGVVKDAQIKAAAESAGRGTGSDTVQKMSMSNLINESGIPTWFGMLPLGNRLGGVAMAAGDKLYKGADERMRSLLADTLKDPQLTIEAMQKAGIKPSKIAEYLRLGAQAPAMAIPGALPAVMNGPQQ